MNEPRQDRAGKRDIGRGYWRLTICCVGIVMTLIWAFLLEHTVLDQHLSLDAAADRVHFDILAAHLRLEESLGGGHAATVPDAPKLAGRHLDDAQQGLAAMLAAPRRAGKYLAAITDDPEWRRQVGDLQQKVGDWRQVAGQMTETAHAPDLGRQLNDRFHELFREITEGVSLLTNHQHTLATAQIRQVRMVQAALLSIGLALIFLVIKTFRGLLSAQLLGEQRSQEQTLRRVAEMTTLNALGRLFDVKANPKSIAQAALQEITALLAPDVVSIYLRQGGDLVPLAIHSQGRELKAIPPDHKRVDQCLCGLASQGQPVYASNLPADARCTFKACQEAGIRSVATLPLLSGQKVIGVLSLGFMAEHDLAQQHLLFESVADQIASGLQNCLLYELSQQQAVKMQEQIQLLALGSEVGTALTQSTTLPEMLAACCSLIVRHLDVAFARVWVMRDDEAILELQASAGMYTRIDGTSRLKAVDQSNKIGAIALAKQPYFSNQLLGDPQIVNQEWVKREKMKAFAGHPLLLGDQVIGVLAMFSLHPLSETVIKLLASIADSVALAIANRKAVQHLQVTRERYRDLIENSSDWIWTVDTKGSYTYSSPQVSRMLGYEPHEVHGRSVFSLMPEAEAERVLKIVDDLNASQQPFVGLEFTGQHKDGHRVILEASGSPIFDGQGHLQGYRGLNRDITAKKTAENAVLDQKRMLEAMFNAVPDAMIYTNTAYQAKMTNPGFSKLFGYAEQEVLGQGLGMLYERLEECPRRGTMALLRQEQGESLPSEINFKHKDGTVFPGEAVWAAIKNTDGEVVGLLHLIRDISQRKQADASQRHAQKMEALGTLSGGIAHDFNNLLNVISGYTALAIDDLDQEGQAAMNLRQVANASERAGALVRQILAFSKGVEEGKTFLSLHHIAKEVARLMAGTLPATIEIKQDIDARCRTVLADASQIHQVLLNLCTNAYHAMRDTGGLLVIGLKEEDLLPGQSADLPAGPYAKLTVTDTGHGMDQAVQDRIFEPYFTTKKVGEGTGLGLATAHGIIKAHGGRITVASQVGKGSTFTIYLPVNNQPPRPQPAMPKADDLVTVQLKGNVLYVDDVPFNVDLGKQILGRAGCQVTGETDSTAALTLFAAAPERFDLVITDQTMPKLTGIDMAKKMLAIRPDLPIIMVSGHSDTVDEEKAKAEGVRELLPKPLKIDQLLSVVGQILQPNGGGLTRPDAQPPAVRHNRRSGDRARVPASLEAVRSHLAVSYGVDQEQLGPMLASMQETLRSELHRARTAAGQPDLRALALAAHTIKGILLNAGLAAWADLAKAIELGAQRDEAKNYGAMLDELAPGIAALLN